MTGCLAEQVSVCRDMMISTPRMDTLNNYDYRPIPVRTRSRPTKLLFGLTVTIVVLVATIVVISFSYPHWRTRTPQITMIRHRLKNITMSATLSCEPLNSSENPRFRWRTTPQKANGSETSAYLSSSRETITPTVSLLPDMTVPTDYNYTTWVPPVGWWRQLFPAILKDTPAHE